MKISLAAPQWNKVLNSYPPLGLGYLAAVLEREGHTVTIHDFGLDPDLSAESAVRRIAADAPDMVGLTAMTNNYHSARSLIAEIRSQLVCPIVLGGPHATLFPEQVLAESGVDYVVFGEGEETLCELIGTLSDGGTTRDLASIAGLCFRDGPDVKVNRARPLIRDLDSLPFPARHLYDLSRYSLRAPNGDAMVTVLSSRGCPYNCSYCFKGIAGRTYRQRSPEQLLDELSQLVTEYGYHNVYFVDDLFTFDAEWVTAVANGMLDRDLDLRWQCLSRVDRVTLQELQLMQRAGCRELHYGIESGNPEVLAQIGKHITMEQVRDAVRWTRQAGILAKGYFMLGLPGDTEETMRQTIQFAGELDLDQAMFSLTTPFPGTRLWEEAAQKYDGLEFEQDFAQAYYYIANQDSLITPFLNVSQVSDDRLAEIAHKAQASFQEAKRRKKYVRALGPAVGGALYGLSNVRLVRQIGKRVVRSSVARSIRGVDQLGDYDMRKELSKKWA